MIKWLFNELLEVDSTQNVLRKLGAAGVSEGTVVVARRQTAGQGRYGRNWVSPEGGLYMSLLLRPPPTAALRSLTQASSLAVARGIKKETGLEASLRWPNDVMVSRRKVAGVIAESNYIGQGLVFVIVGIGVNCNSKLFPQDLSDSATSLAEQKGSEVDILRLRQAILDAFVPIHEDWIGGRDVVSAAKSITETIGKQVTITMKSGGVREGVAHDIEQAGGLVLDLGDRKLVVQAEDVELLRER